MNYQRGSQIIILIIIIILIYTKVHSMRGVRKEINHSDPSSNAPDKAQQSMGCTHSLAALARAQMGTTQTQLCFILGI